MSKNRVDERVCELWQDKDQSPFGLKSLSAHRFLESTALTRGLFHRVVCYMFQRHSVDSLHRGSLGYTGLHAMPHLSCHV